MKNKNVVILGSTGSIGINTLEVIRQSRGAFRIVGLTAYNNFDLLLEQIKEFAPKYVAVPAKGFDFLKSQCSRKLKILSVENDLDDLVSLKEVDVVVVAMRGSSALKPFLKAVRSGKVVAPANKEALVIAGDILLSEAKKYGATVIPIDSEQSAIFQCLDGRDRKSLKKIYLTASGGPLLNVRKEKFDTLTVDQILQHPRWKMGKKITVDSANLMNKGFEVIEATRLFDVSVDEIEVIIHPEAIIHSMVEFVDGSILAQLSATDMKFPIQYALTYPERLTSSFERLDFSKLGQLNFQKPDFKRFPALKLAIEVAKLKKTFPSVLNAADEEAVEAFLNQKISFTSIYRIVDKIIGKHKPTGSHSLENILAADHWAREEARRLIYN